MNIGFHISTSKGYPEAIDEAIKFKANTFQFFPRNPRGSKARKIEKSEIQNFKILSDKLNFGSTVCHGAYTMNLASNKESVREHSKTLMKEDFSRIKSLGIEYYVFHPGSHVGQGEDKGLNLIVEALNEILIDEDSFFLCLETMSGKGTELGYNFEQLKYLLDNIKYDKLGICLDTCHIYSAGYNIKDDFNSVLNHFDNIIGLDKVKVLHFNDSKTEFNSKKDRHEKIGLGSIGLSTFRNFLNYRFLNNIPIILETPNDLKGYMKEIELLYELRDDYE